MLLKKIIPVHIIFGVLALVIALLSIAHIHLDYTFLLITNGLLWLVSALSLYIYFSSLKNKNAAASINAVNATVLLKLIVIAIFIPVYHKLVHAISYVNLLCAFIMYVTYSVVQVKLSTRKTNN